VSFFRQEKWNQRGRVQATYLGIASSVCLTLFWSLLVGIPVSLARDEQIIQQVSGKLHQHLEPFTINDDWELRWDYKGEVGNDLFQIVLQSTPTDVPVDVVTQKGSGQGTKHQKKGGTYYLKVVSMGKWTITVVQLR
jgi:hypothetical protein